MHRNKLGYLSLLKKSPYLMVALVCLSGCYNEKPYCNGVVPHTKESYKQYKSDLEELLREQTEDTVKQDSLQVIKNSYGRQK